MRAAFPQPARTVSFVTRDDLNLGAWDIPAEAQRGLVVMFHGYAVLRSALLGSARVLHELGWRTVLVDHRGSGRHGGPARGRRARGRTLIPSLCSSAFESA